MDSLEKAKKIAAALSNRKGEDIRVIGVRDLTILADYFVFASGTSNPHLRALTEEVEFKMSELGIEPKQIEGKNSDRWLVLDYGDVVVHIFHTETRDYYRLERLWSDGEEIDLSDIL